MPPGGRIRCSATLTIRAVVRRYCATLRLTVGPDYPDGGIGVESLRSTGGAAAAGKSGTTAGAGAAAAAGAGATTVSGFPTSIAEIFLLQARELSRRCAIGYSAEVALRASNPIAAPPPHLRGADGTAAAGGAGGGTTGGKKKGSGRPAKVTNSTMRELKHDGAWNIGRHMRVYARLIHVGTSFSNARSSFLPLFLASTLRCCLFFFFVRIRSFYLPPVAVLKQVSDLKGVQTARDRRNQNDLHSTQVKKDARKELRKLGAEEIARDTATEQRLTEAAQEEARAIAAK